MKSLTMLLGVLMMVSAVAAEAQTVQAGIFALDATTIAVRAKVSGGSFSVVPLTNVVVTIYWESSLGLTISDPSGSNSFGKAGAVGTDGIFSYQKFATAPTNVTLAIANGGTLDLFTVTISGTSGPALLQLHNTPDGSGDWYFEVSGLDYTNTGTPFYVQSTELALPVTLTSFSGKLEENGTGVMLQWATASEVNNYGYTVQRKLACDAAFVDVADAFVAGHGTTVAPQTYAFTDNTVPGAGRYEYRLKQQDLNGGVQFTQSVIVNVTTTAVVESAPREFQLMQNYPNPFNPTTMVKFSVPSTGQATVKVYDTMGREVMTLFDGAAEAGRYYAVSFNASNLASGVYFYRLVTAQKTDIRRMMLLK